MIETRKYKHQKTRSVLSLSPVLYHAHETKTIEQNDRTIISQFEWNIRGTLLFLAFAFTRVDFD